MFFFNIDNIKKCSWAPNQHFRMISEVSCYTQVCNHRNKSYLKTLKQQIIFHNITFLLYCLTPPKNAALMSLREQTSYWPQFF